ncbi:MAG: YncE family protein [Flavobacteriaceae bacterium]|nr:YncE family protein [Flavobacteriaceae bacterium]
MNAKKIIIGLFIAALTFTSCSDDEGVVFQPTTPTTETPLGAYENGVLIVNQGGWTQGNASVSFVSNDFSVSENGVFNNVNDTPLGDVGQSIAFYNDLAYIVVNNSQKIEVVNRYTFASVSTINTGLNNPRYMAFANGKGYVTNWGDSNDANDDFIAIIDLASNTMTSTIAVGEGPEQILTLNNTLYITHKGGYGQNNIVSVINTTDSSVSTITVGDTPDEMVLDSSNNIWVLCEGRPSYAAPETAGKLVKINTTDNTVATTIDFQTTTDHPKVLAYESGYLYYYIDEAIYKMDETDSTLPTNSFISQALTEGDLAIHSGKLYGTRADYNTGDSEIVIYDLTTTNLIQSVDLNTGAYHIYFN